MSKAVNEQSAGDQIVFKTVTVHKEDGVLLVEMKSPPMNLLGPELIRDLVSLMVVEDVHYSPRWSWEIEQIIERPLDELPPDLAPIARDWIAALEGKL